MSIDRIALRQTLTYTATASISQIFADIDELAAIDRSAEQEQTRYSELLKKYSLGLFISLVLIGVFFFVFPLLAIPLGLVFVGFLIASIQAGTMRAKHGRLNLQNYKYELLKKILQMLERDMDQNEHLSVSLVFSSPTAKEKLLNTVPHPRRSGFKVDSFKDEWLKIEGRFLDKTKFSLTNAEFNQTIYGWKRSTSGKSKYKTKSKAKGLNLSLNLTYPTRRYGAVKVLKNDVIGAIKLPATATLKRIGVTDEGIKLTVSMPPSILTSPENLYQVISLMFLSLYQVLNLAKMLSRRKEA